MLTSTQGLAFNKCKINGTTVYQDATCPEAVETIAQAEKRKKSYEIYFIELDTLAKKGEGNVEKRKNKPAPEPTITVREAGDFLHHGSREERIQRELEMHQRNTIQSNAKSAASMTERYNKQMVTCKGKIHDDVEIGMKLSVFGNCLKFRHYYTLTNVVTITRENHEFKLYLYPSNYPHRVYLVDGVVVELR